MIPIQGLFETHVTARRLETSVAFFWLGGRGHVMLGVCEAGSAPNRMSLHLAFTASAEAILSAPARSELEYEL